MYIIELVKLIKSPDDRESNNAQGELIRITDDWINSNVSLKKSIFTQICHKYHVHNSPDSINEMKSIYYDSIVRLINNIKDDKLDRIDSQSAFEAYSKMICANVCKEWLTNYKGAGMVMVPVYKSYKRICLVMQNDEYIKNKNGFLRVFNNSKHANDFIERNKSVKESKVILVNSINDEDILLQIAEDKKINYVSLDDLYKESQEPLANRGLTYGQLKELENFLEIYKNSISTCRYIYDVCFTDSKAEEQYNTWVKIHGNESRTFGAYKRKKSTCIKRLIEKIKKSAEFQQANGSVDDFIDSLLGDEIYGCTDPSAINYDEIATIDDDSCIY